MCQENAGHSFSPLLVLPFLWRSCSEQRFWAFQGHFIHRFVYLGFSFPFKVQTQSSGAEPGSYSHLTEASVLRGLVNFLQAKSQLSPHPSITAKASPLLVCIISLLASNLGRPLPPLDWTFLDSLHESAMLRLVCDKSQSWEKHVLELQLAPHRPAVVELLCRQAANSRTARALVERNLASELDRETTEAYATHLLLIAKAVPAPLLGLFVLNSVMKVKESGAKKELELMLHKVEETLSDPDLPAPSQESLVRTIEELLECIPPDEDHFFKLHLGVASLLPLPTFQKLSSPSSCGLERAILYRSALASSQGTKTRLTCLNDVIEAACSAQSCSQLLPALQVCLGQIKHHTNLQISILVCCTVVKNWSTATLICLAVRVDGSDQPAPPPPQSWHPCCTGGAPGRVHSCCGCSNRVRHPPSPLYLSNHMFDHKAWSAPTCSS